MQIKIIPIDIFLSDVYILIGAEEKDFTEFYQNNKVCITEDERNAIVADIKNADCNSVTYALDSGAELVFIREGHDKYETVIDEMLHVAIKAVGRCEINDTNHNVCGYLCAWLIRQYYRK